MHLKTIGKSRMEGQRPQQLESDNGAPHSAPCSRPPRNGLELANLPCPPTNQGVGTLQKKAAKKQHRQALWSTKHFKWAPDVCI